MKTRIVPSPLRACAQRPTFHPGIEPLEARIAPASVVIFENTGFVDTSTSGMGEAFNIQKSLESLGHTVTTFTGITAGAINAALAGKDMLVIPELEVGDLSLALDASAKAALASYVAEGGGLIITGENSGRAASLLNAVFGFSLGVTPNAGASTKTAAAAGTAFGTGPASLPANNLSTGLPTASIPVGGKSIYTVGSTTTVGLIPVGEGEIVYLAWDWFQGAPTGPADGGWIPTLGLAVNDAIPNAPLAYTVTNVHDLTLHNNGANIELFQTSNPANILASQPAFNVSSVRIKGADGVGDILTVDSTNGLIVVGEIDFDGGTGFDSLRLVQSAGATRTSDTLAVGAASGSGQSIITDGSGTQTVSFQNLEPVIDSVPATTFSITSLPGLASLLQAGNAINYTASQIVAAGGRITVDSFEPIEFVNKTNLVIDGGAGDDIINLHDDSTAHPAGLNGTITVNGGDPAGHDTLIVNGIAGVLDNLRCDPTSVAAGTVVNDNEPQPNVFFTGIEQVTLVVQQADGDSVRVDGTAGNDAFEFFPGATGSSGSFVGTMDQNNASGFGPFTMTPINYTGASPVANDVDVNFFGNVGGIDSLIFHGTANDDTLAVAQGEAGGNDFRDTVNGLLISRLEVFNIASAVVHGHEGSDVFNVSAGAPNIALTVEGEEGANGLNFTGFFNATTTLVPAAKTITISGPGALGVTYAEFDWVSLTGVGPIASLVVTGSNANDTFAVTPAAVGAGSFSVVSVGLPAVQDVAFSYSGQNVFTVNGGTGGFDVLQIIGSEAADHISAVGSLVTVANAGTSTVTIGSGLERLDVFALGGSDRVDLSALPTLPTRILGGDGDDNLIGSPQDDLIDGGTGKDVIHGGAGHNTLLNNGPFGFTSPTAYDVAKLPSAVIAANLNGDAFADLIVVNRGAGTVSVLLGTATGRFADPVSFKTGGLQPNSVAVGDFNGDTRLDLAVANGGSKNIGILLGDGAGSFADATKVAVKKAVAAIQTARLDNDTTFDLALISGNKVLELTGIGDGTFNPAKAFATRGVKPVALVIADFNLDNLKDIATVNAGSGNVSLLPGSATTGFGAAVTFKAGVQPGALVVGDFDGDGAVDLAVANKGSTFVSILRGTGSAGAVQFQRQLKVANPGKTAPSAIATEDLNGDGVLDLAIANGATGSFRVLLGIGTGLFNAPVDISLGGSPSMKPSALVIGDFDGDGAMDIAVTGLGSGDVSVALQAVG